ncbi:MAG: hypothetical protein ICV53_18610 [Flavisolibacter sp.]|nr:hypothetical protein [Flavisolibacter sp.]
MLLLLARKPAKESTAVFLYFDTIFIAVSFTYLFDFLSPQSCSGILYWQMIAAIPVAEARIPEPQSLPAAVEPDGGGHRQLSMSRGNKNCGCYSVNEGIGKDKASLIAQ